jgi:hypothetical protein
MKPLASSADTVAALSGLLFAAVGVAEADVVDAPTEPPLPVALEPPGASSVGGSGVFFVSL